MLFFGHRFLESEVFYHISDIDAVVKTAPGGTIYLEFAEENLDIIDYLRANEIAFVLHVENITELLYAHALGAKYVTVEKDLAKTAQKIAEEYLFDTKILAHIQNEEEIEELAFEGIDGVIFSTAIVKVPT